MKKIWLAGAILLAATGCQKAAVPADYSKSEIKIGGSVLHVDVADTDASRARGLSGRISMAEDQGMLFDFRNDKDSRPGFWMKDMKFGLDLIWINNNKIVGITADVPPPQSGQPLQTYYPPGDIDMVIEVNAGSSERHGVRVGDEVSQISNY